MQRILHPVRKGVLFATALLLATATWVPITLNHASAAGQATSRLVRMSSSTPSATGVTYFVSFNPTGTTNIGAIVVDICADTPLVETTTCTYPAAFSWGGATPTTGGNPTGFSTSTGSWITTNSLQGGAAGGSRQVFMFSNTTAQTPTGSGTAITFSVTGVANTSVVGSFYARIVTFDTSANAVTQYTASGTTRNGTLTNKVDYGGVALSTAAAINLTARVMETLAFCVYTTACGDSTATELGTGTPAAIDSASVYTKTLNFSLSTNALTGAVVNLKGDTLTSGGNSLTAAGTISAIAAGSGKFGVKVGTPTATSGSITATANYLGTAGNYGLVTANTTSTYGDPFANTSSLPVNGGVAPFTYGASAATTTPAGIYTATHQLIATGTF